MGAAVGETVQVQVLEAGIPILTVDRPTSCQITRKVSVRERRPLGTSDIEKESDFDGTDVALVVPLITPEVMDLVNRISAKAYRRTKPNLTVERTDFYPETGATRTHVVPDCHLGSVTQSADRNADNTVTLNFESGKEAVYG